MTEPTLAEMLAELPIGVLRTVHRSAFGAETKMRDRAKVARKIANAIDAKPVLASKVQIAVNLAMENAPSPAVRSAVERFRKAATACGTSVTLTAGGKSVTMTPDDRKLGKELIDSKKKGAKKKGAKKKGGTTATRISAAVQALEPDKARSLLSEVGSSFLEEERLREEKKAERKEINERIDDSRLNIAAAVKGAEHDTDPGETLRKVETLWGAVVADEDELADVTKDYTGRINKARDRIRSTLDNLRQEKLPGIE